MTRRFSGTGRRSRGSILAVLPLAAVAACGEGSTQPSAVDDFDFQVGNALLASGEDVTLRAEAARWAPGAPVTLELQNGSGGTVGFNLCFHALERRTAEAWSLLQGDRVCTAHLDTLAPGGRHRHETHLPGTLPPGEYRFRVALYLLKEKLSRDVVSAPFSVD